MSIDLSKLEDVGPAPEGDLNIGVTANNESGTDVPIGVYVRVEVGGVAIQSTLTEAGQLDGAIAALIQGRELVFGLSDITIGGDTVTVEDVTDGHSPEGTEADEAYDQKMAKGMDLGFKWGDDDPDCKGPFTGVFLRMNGDDNALIVHLEEFEQVTGFIAALGDVMSKVWPEEMQAVTKKLQSAFQGPLSAKPKGFKKNTIRH